MVTTLDCRGDSSWQCGGGGQSFGVEREGWREEHFTVRSPTHLGPVVKGSSSGHKSC